MMALWCGARGMLTITCARGLLLERSMTIQHYAHTEIKQLRGACNELCTVGVLIIL
jgi:hypothetical protein